MAEAKRRGYGEDGIYFGHRGDCRDGAHHKTCSGRRRGVVSLGFDASGKRIRKKVSDPTRTEVKDKLKALHSELTRASGPSRGYTVEGAVADWLAGGLPGRAAKTVEVYREGAPNLCRRWRQHQVQCSRASTDGGRKWIRPTSRLAGARNLSRQAALSGCLRLGARNGVRRRRGAVAMRRTR
jgi:hypothetical protein